MRLLQTKLSEYNIPIGTIARKYTLPVILTVFRPSRRVLVLERIWVNIVANMRCQHVNRTAVRDVCQLSMSILKKKKSEYIWYLSSFDGDRGIGGTYGKLGAVSSD